jgi:hypothetical protein
VLLQQRRTCAAERKQSQIILDSRFGFQRRELAFIHRFDGRNRLMDFVGKCLDRRSVEGFFVAVVVYGRHIDIPLEGSTLACGLGLLCSSCASYRPPERSLVIQHEKHFTQVRVARARVPMIKKLASYERTLIPCGKWLMVKMKRLTSVRNVTFLSHPRHDNLPLRCPGCAVTVRGEGDTWIMEQLGEKQDFEAELSRLGFRHEDFMLDVRRVRPTVVSPWTSNYAVRVTNRKNGKSNIYWGGPGKHWVAQFARDLGEGFFGHAVAPSRAVCTPRPGGNQ